MVFVAWASVPGCGPGPPANAGVETGLDPPAALTKADGFYRAQEYDSAEVGYRSVRERARQRADPASEAAATLGLARVSYRRDDDYQAAGELARDALALQRRHGLDRQVFETTTLLGLIAYDEGRYLESVELQAAARDQAAAAADTGNLFKAWTNLALPQIELGDLASARSNLEQALAVAAEHGTTLGEGRVLLNLGMLAIRAGHPHEGVRLLERARARAREAGDGDAELNLLGHLGIAHAQMGEPGRGIAYLDTARTWAREREDAQEEASSLEQTAGILLDAGEYPRALRLLDEANAINQRLGLNDEAAANLRSIALIHLQLRRFEQARQAAVEALAVHREAGARLSLLEDLLLLGRIAAEEGRGESATAHLAEARALAERLGTRAARLDVALAEARVADLFGRAGEVLGAIDAVRDDWSAGGIDREWEAHWLTARAYARRGSIEQEAEAGSRAVDAVERARGGFASAALRTSVLSEREGVYHDLVAALLRLDRIDEAFETADRTRGRVLAEHLATVGTDGGATVRELAEEERALLSGIESLSEAIGPDRATGTKPDPLDTERAALYAELERIRNDYTAALTRADERDARRLPVTGSARPTAAAIRAALAGDEALLEFLVMPDRVLLFVARIGGIVHFERGVDRDDLFTRVRVVRELVRRPGSPASAAPALESLHQLLFAEVRRAGTLAGVTTLIIVPHAELTYLPFAALRDPASGRYLVEDFELLNLPSAATLPGLRRRPARGPAGSFAFAPFAKELPGTDRELEALVRGFGAQTRRGRDATESEVRSALVDAELVHLATHGVLNARSPLFSRLELRPPRGKPTGPENDGRLEVHEIDRLEIRASLVVLSSCETAAGAALATRFSPGEDYATLELAFLQAGAANVMGTLWRVDDESTARLIERFYAALAAARAGGRARPAAALREAQLAMLRDSSRSAPYHWAGFRVSGAGRYPLGVGAQGIEARSVLAGYGLAPTGLVKSRR